MATNYDLKQKLNQQQLAKNIDKPLDALKGIADKYDKNGKIVPQGITAAIEVGEVTAISDPATVAKNREEQEIKDEAERKLLMERIQNDESLYLDNIPNAIVARKLFAFVNADIRCLQWPSLLYYALNKTSPNYYFSIGDLLWGMLRYTRNSTLNSWIEANASAYKDEPFENFSKYAIDAPTMGAFSVLQFQFSIETGIDFRNILDYEGSQRDLILKLHDMTCEKSHVNEIWKSLEQAFKFFLNGKREPTKALAIVEAARFSNSPWNFSAHT